MANDSSDDEASIRDRFRRNRFKLTEPTSSEYRFIHAGPIPCPPSPNLSGASMNADVPFCGRLWGWLRSETKVCMHALVSLGTVLSELFASMHAIVSPGLQGDGLDGPHTVGRLPGAGVVWHVPPASSTASDAKWSLVQSMRWTIRNSIALTSSRREFRIRCGIIHVKRINRTASGNKIRI